MTYPKDWKPPPRTRLSPNQMAELKSCYAIKVHFKKCLKERLSNEALAKHFGVNVSTVERAIKSIILEK